MNRKIKAILAIAAIVGIAIGIFLISGYIEEQKQEKQEIGIWKPDREAEKKAIERFRNEVFPDVEKYEITIETYIDPTGLTPPRQEMRAIRYGFPQSYEKEINEEEAGKIALEFIRNHSDFFGVSENDELEIKKIEKMKVSEEFFIEFKPQTYKGIPFCYRATNSVVLSKDGRFEVAIWQWYQNVTAPTEPKITEQQAKKILAQKFADILKKLNLTEEHIEGSVKKCCIFPFYHKDGDFWSYHLAGPFRVPGAGNVYLDTITGEVLFVERPY